VDPYAAAERLQGQVHCTPVLSCTALDAWAGRTLALKCENFQRAGSFKIRGASNAVSKLPEGIDHVVTASSGNYGQALAVAARQHGLRCTVVVPSDAPAVKLAAMQGYGATIVLCEPTLADRQRVLEETVEATGGTWLCSHDHPDVIEGQGTVAVELMEQVPGLDAIIAPIGGGGLVAGIALACRDTGVRAYAGEPFGADDAWRSLDQGVRIEEPHPKTIAGGLLVSLGEHNWPVVRDHVTGIIRVSEDEILEAMRLCWERAKLVIEPSSAVALAAARKLPDEVQDVGVVLSGGNVDLGKLPF
jgi:threonine dehydratase